MAKLEIQTKFHSKPTSKQLLSALVEKFLLVTSQNASEENAENIISGLYQVHDRNLSRDLLYWESIWAPTSFVIDVLINSEDFVSVENFLQLLGKEENQMIDGHASRDGKPSVILSQKSHEEQACTRQKITIELVETERNYVSKMQLIERV